MQAHPASPQQYEYRADSACRQDPTLGLTVTFHFTFGHTFCDCTATAYVALPSSLTCCTTMPRPRHSSAMLLVKPALALLDSWLKAKMVLFSLVTLKSAEKVGLSGYAGLESKPMSFRWMQLM